MFGQNTGSHKQLDTTCKQKATQQVTERKGNLRIKNIKN
jgi:hypothetical protein